MPGFLGGSSGGGGGAGGEIRFPKEFIDPVTKLRVSQPETLIDTDFEYGLQPTKWETLELINNTPSFFSKSGDTTIPGIVSVTTNAGTREITVTTALEHGLAVGIPINVTGSKSVTADGAYIINSIPNPNTFTYLCKDNQAETLSIEDLYTSIITGEFFQGSQLRIANSEGIITDGESVSLLTVTTESAHGFGVNTPFYFLNLNSTVAQEFESANTAAKSFDSTNSATAQTFDGSNTLSQIQIDWSNSATVGGTASNISSIDTSTDRITVSHTLESFLGSDLGAPLYYEVLTAAGYFSQNPRGVVFLKSIDELGSASSTFQVSELPDGDPIDIVANMTGTFQLANQARTFPGNNINESTQQTFSVIRDDAIEFEGANDGGLQEGGLFLNGNPNCTVTNYSGSLINVSVPEDAGLGYYTGAMVLYSTTGSSASGLVNNSTYFIDSFFPTGSDTFAFTVKSLPTDESPVTVSGGTGEQTFKRIGVSLDKDIWHIKDSNYREGDMLVYEYPEDGSVSTDTNKKYFFVKDAYDEHNYVLNDDPFNPTVATGGFVTQVTDDGGLWNVHRFTTVGTSTFTVADIGTDPTIEYLIVGGGGGGGMDMGGGGGGGGVLTGSVTLTSTGNYTVTVGGGGIGAPRAGTGTGTQGRTSHVYTITGTNGGNSSWNGITALGGGRGGMSVWSQSNFRASGQLGGSGGGASGYNTPSGLGAGAGTSGQGFAGGVGRGNYWSGGGGGAGGVGGDGTFNYAPFGGPGKYSDILGIGYYWGGGGGGSGYSGFGGYGGIGGGGGGAVGTTIGGAGLNNGANGGGGSINAQTNRPGGSGGANTGGGGGGGSHYTATNQGGNGGSGIVVLRYRVTAKLEVSPVATGGEESVITVNGKAYKVHKFTDPGSSLFNVLEPGNMGPFEYLIVGGGGGGGADMGGGGGGGGVVEGTFNPVVGEYPVVVGDGGLSSGQPYASRNINSRGNNGGNSSVFSVTALGGCGAAGVHDSNSAPARTGGAGGGGASGRNGNWSVGTPGQGFEGGTTGGQWYAGGGGGAGSFGLSGRGGAGATGGDGKPSSILGTTYWFGGGGGASGYTARAGNGGRGGGGGGGHWSAGGPGTGDTQGLNPAGSGTGSTSSGHGGSGGENTGGGAGGHAHQAANSTRKGGSGIVVIRYPIQVI